MKRNTLNIRFFITTVSLLMILAGARASFAAATITIVNNDPAGVGFNDTTPVAPVGGNSGTTLGQQRLIAFQEAANIWGAALTSTVTIEVRAQWIALTCSANSAVLGSAGSVGIFRDFTGAPFAGTWYGQALSNKLFGADVSPANPDMNANFNVNLGQPNCLAGSPFYLGLDGNEGAGVDLVAVLLHEMGHGLGFQTFTSGSSGAFNGGFPSVYDRFLIDTITGESWVSMDNTERQASAINNRELAWNGPQVIANVPAVLAPGVPTVRINAPPANTNNYFSGTVAFGPVLTAGGVTGTMQLANDPTPPVTDLCEAVGPGTFAGRIAVADRGLCTAKAKALNAQNAGAIGLVIINNIAGTDPPNFADDPTIVTPITIPTATLTLTDGNAVKSALAVSALNATILLDTARRFGADEFNKALMFTPNPFQGGSSVSHWDTLATPNQLMEPAINFNLTHSVQAPQDLSFSLMSDVGWVTTVLPTTLTKTAGDNQTVAGNTVFPTALQVTGSPAVAGLQVTWTVRPGLVGAASANFPGGLKTAVTLTNAAGVATAPPLTANLTPGTYPVNATIPGAGTVVFNLINLAPTASEVSISGRVMTAEGRGITNAFVTVTDASGVSRTVITGRRGGFMIDGLESGATYVVTVGSRRFTFTPRVITLTDSLTGVDFIPE